MSRLFRMLRGGQPVVLVFTIRAKPNTNTPDQPPEPPTISVISPEGKIIVDNEEMSHVIEDRYGFEFTAPSGPVGIWASIVIAGDCESALTPSFELC